MMQHVEAPQHASGPALRLTVVQVIMHHVIGEIANDEAHKDRIAEGKAEKEPPNRKGNQHDRTAEEHRHHKAQRIFGMLVVHAMDQEMDSRAEASGKEAMEEIPVAEIFDQSPDEIAEHRRQKDESWAIIVQAQSREKKN